MFIILVNYGVESRAIWGLSGETGVVGYAKDR